jgi:hypothetical protein
MKIAIIGNGSTALNKKNGNFIDSCDVVVRIKNFRLKGFEKNVGSKIDWFASKWFSWYDRQTFEPLNLEFISYIKNLLFMFFEEGTYDNRTLLAYNEYVSLYAQLQLKNEFPFMDGSWDKHLSNLNFFKIENKPIHYFTPYEINQLANEELKMTKRIYKGTSDKGKYIIEPTVGIRTIYKILKIYPKDEIFISGFDGFMSSWYWDPKHEINLSHNYLTERIYLKKLIKSKAIYNLDE